MLLVMVVLLWLIIIINLICKAPKQETEAQISLVLVVLLVFLLVVLLVFFLVVLLVFLLVVLLLLVTFQRLNMILY